MAKIALAHDHILLRNGLAELIKNLGHTVVFQADNGNDMMKKLNPKKLPDIVLMDINMPGMDGCEATKWLRNNYPQVKVLALSMFDNESAIIRMLKCRASGYVLKDCRPAELKEAIEAVMTEGFYNSELINGKLIHAINKMDIVNDDINKLVSLHEKEIEFLKLACSELTYRQIAEKLIVSVRTVDSYRDILFKKLCVKTRIGLVIYALKNNIAHL